MQNRNYIKVFRDKERLKQMLELANKGWSYVALGKHFGCDHTSILYQCRKNGVLKNLYRKNRKLFFIKRNQFSIINNRKIYKINRKIYNISNISPIDLLSYNNHLEKEKMRKMSKIDKILLDKGVFS